MASDSKTTFADLDGLHSSKLPRADDAWPLEEWYAQIRETPINALGAGHIAKACRQEMWLEHTVPRAIELLSADFLAGDLYDGELAVALRSVSAEFWGNHPELGRSLLALSEGGLPQLDGDERHEVEELMQTIKAG